MIRLLARQQHPARAIEEILKRWQSEGIKIPSRNVSASAGTCVSAMMDLGAVGLPFVNWRCLRTSHATWLVQAGADPKSVQGQMRHSRIATTMDIYAQCVPAAQRRAIEKLSEFANASRSKPVTLLSQ